MDQVVSCHRLLIGALPVEVSVKPIKHLHLSVVPPDGAVRISAPEGMTPENVRAYIISRLTWIRRQQSRFGSQQRESPRQAMERESHHLWGRRLLLHIEEVDRRPKVEAQPRRLVLGVRPGCPAETRRQLLSDWFRAELRREAQRLLPVWQEALGVRSHRLYLQAMTRRWGSCNPASGNIRLNTQLVHKPIGCLEYVLLHELAHLRVRTHGRDFLALLDRHMPDWQERRRLLNSLPLATPAPQLNP